MCHCKPVASCEAATLSRACGIAGLHQQLHQETAPESGHATTSLSHPTDCRSVRRRWCLVQLRMELREVMVGAPRLGGRKGDEPLLVAA